MGLFKYHNTDPIIRSDIAQWVRRGAIDIDGFLDSNCTDIGYVMELSPSYRVFVDVTAFDPAKGGYLDKTTEYAIEDDGSTIFRPGTPYLVMPKYFIRSEKFRPIYLPTRQLARFGVHIQDATDDDWNYERKLLCMTVTRPTIIRNDHPMLLVNFIPRNT